MHNGNVEHKLECDAALFALTYQSDNLHKPFMPLWQVGLSKQIMLV